ncbi:ABC transporter ATP-binding protein [Georgenia sp. EYE_87]|uniref:ABC transporter ATP-binding protein n=1 Tax=Georgenia sp. EYE_87 TaxID=2853448 RepID=UPI002003A254|nr:ABC transporter ATP-binding protein [Georgenia sp. EYE_87]
MPPPRGRSNPITVARKARAAWRRLAPFFQTSRLKMFLLVAGSVLAGVAEAALLAVVGAIAGALSNGVTDVTLKLGPVGLSEPLDVMFAAGVGLAVVRGALQMMLAYLPASMSAHAVANLRRLLFDSFTRAAWPVKASERDGQFQSLMTTHVNATSYAIITLGTGISAALVFVTLLVSAFVLSLPAAVMLSVVSTGIFLMLRPVSRRLRRHAAALSTENIEYSKGVQEVVLMAEETEVFGASPSYLDAFHHRIDGIRRPMLRTRFLAQGVPALYQSIALLLLVLALGVIALVGMGEIASLAAVVLILLRALTYGQQVQTAVTGLDERVPFMHHLADAVERYTANPRQDGPRHLPEVVERIGMRGVRFGYGPDTEVLKGLTFSVGRGEAIGIAGPSGAGKSSLVQLLLRLRIPTAGALEVNGTDAREFRRDEWQRRVAYVPQTPQLVWGTVADNIRFYRPHLTQEDIESAARRAQIHDEIMSWENGYDTVVGQRAAAVSGGQRQRICLARALADRPEILVLDEPTSALDVRSESLVKNSLHELKGSITLFMVGHRLSTLSFCDRIMVVADGRLEAFAPPHELMATNSFYREVTELTRQQSGS